jgi:ferric-dicitrate binding protein FerR (iron transport regulator)
MTIKIIDIANRFLSEQACSRQELIELKKWLADPSSQIEVEKWLSDHWESSLEINSDALIESVFCQIEEYEKNHVHHSGFILSGFVNIYQKVAAVLLIPLIGLGILYQLNQHNPSAIQYTETIAPRGQKSQIVLSDGTKVWLNSDTKIRYPGQFDKNQRDVYLDGEAFFEVTKNEHQPFLVHTLGPEVKVVGTKFNIKAYADENQVETSLFEGRVDLLLKNKESNQIEDKELKPGQSLIYSGISQQLTSVRFPKDEIDGWKKNQLIFKDDTFIKLVKKIERWYNVEVVYDERKFDNRRLTVELFEGERLEKLMDILSLALSVNYRYEQGKIYLTPKTIRNS